MPNGQSHSVNGQQRSAWSQCKKEVHPGNICHDMNLCVHASGGRGGSAVRGSGGQLAGNHASTAEGQATSNQMPSCPGARPAGRSWRGKKVSDCICMLKRCSGLNRLPAKSITHPQNTFHWCTHCSARMFLGTCEKLHLRPTHCSACVSPGNM